MVGEPEAQPVGVVLAEPTGRLAPWPLLRVAVVAGLAVAAWLLCGSATCRAAAPTGPGHPGEASGHAPSLSHRLARLVHPLAATNPAGTAAGRAGVGSQPVEVASRRPVVPRSVAAPVARTVGLVRTVQLGRTVPLKNVPCRLTGAAGPVARLATPASAPVTGVLGLLDPLRPAGPTDLVGPTGSADTGPGRSEQRPSAVPLLATSTGERPGVRPAMVGGTRVGAPRPSTAWAGIRVPDPSRPGSRRAPAPVPTGGQPPVPSAPPAPTDASAQSGPSAGPATLPVDGRLDVGMAGQLPDRRAGSGALRQRTDDPSVTPD